MKCHLSGCSLWPHFIFFCLVVILQSSSICQPSLVFSGVINHAQHRGLGWWLGQLMLKWNR